jgi:RNA polymerase sigma-70 factor (ECF subfamily)
MASSGSLTGSSSSSSFSLVDGLQTGSSEAWTRMVDLYAPLVRSWCNYAGVAEHRIPDILQEVFLAVHRSVAQFQPRDATAGFRGWIWMITKNKIRDHFRAVGGQPSATGGSSALNHLYHLADPVLSDDAPSEPSDTTSLLRRAMEMVRVDFQRTTWDAFWRATVLGQPTDVIARELNVSTAAVRQAKSRVLRRLRQQLGDLE